MNMATKKELEKQNRELNKAVMLYFVIALASLIMVAWLAVENMSLQRNDDQCPISPPQGISDPDKFVHGYVTPVDEFINISDLDPSCILDIRDYTHIGGSVWADIAPECVEINKHTYRKE